MKHHIVCFVALLVVLVCTTQSQALTLFSVDRGWYYNTNLHNASNTNYIVGKSSGIEHRNFFVFDLSSVAEPIGSATLRIWNPPEREHYWGQGYISGNPTETFTLFDVSTPIEDLIAGYWFTEQPSPLIGTFEDLGSGNIYGSTTVSLADNGTFISIPLNTKALFALNATGGLFAFGGALTTLQEGSVFEYVFGGSGPGYGLPAELNITFVPEPSTVTFLIFGLLGLVGILYKQNN